MATVVRIRVGEDKITIEDNGEGMTRDELVKFFYISYTGKEEGSIKVKGNMKREIIGKFGIGKLTMYRICKSFEIVSWRGNKAFKATFDFEEFAKNEFVDEFDLKVVPVNEYFDSDSGTMLVLKKLKSGQIHSGDIGQHT
jgi:HSP90 family molecular chaperone